LKAFSFRAGFDVRIRLAMAASEQVETPVYSAACNKSKLVELS